MSLRLRARSADAVPPIQAQQSRDRITRAHLGSHQGEPRYVCVREINGFNSTIPRWRPTFVVITSAIWPPQSAKKKPPSRNVRVDRLRSFTA
jgi:hypothetical protein